MLTGRVEGRAGRARAEGVGLQESARAALDRGLISWAEVALRAICVTQVPMENSDYPTWT